ncbi:hypothetical protein [Nocardia asteroides]|uniref:hypothetical protein n=1 Tax=Nocardia asteroides TaxID=1824 RepID=UPI00365DD3B0
MTDQPEPLEHTREFAAVEFAELLDDQDAYPGPSPRIRLIALVVVAALLLGAAATVLVILLA